MVMYVGLDVHCKQTFYVVQDEQGELLGQGRIASSIEGFTELINKLRVPVNTSIGLETGTQSTWVSEVLCTLNMSPVVIDAREVRAKARRINQKSDRRDAFEICDGLRRGIYTSIVYVPPPEIRRLREIISRRRHFVNLCTGQVNAVRFVLRSRGYNRIKAYLKRPCGWKKLLEEPLPESLRTHLEMHARVWELCHKQVLLLDQELDEALTPFTEIANRLMTTPGIGIITAATYIASLGTPARFPTCAHVVSYLGLAVSTYDSGESQRHGHITKMGSPETRAMLCEAAHHASSSRHPLNPYFRKACSRRGYKTAVVNVAQRLARILYQLWKKEEDFDVSKLNVKTEGKLITRRIYYQIKSVDRKSVVAY